MAQVSPIIQDGILTYLWDGSDVQIMVDSSDWYAWLQSASTFTFRGEESVFTAHKERAGNRRGRAYWRAYRKRDGKLHRAYLGQSEELTLERLQSVAVMLANKEEGEHTLEMPGLEGGTRPSSEASSRASHQRQTAIGAHSPHEATFFKPWLASLPVLLTALIGREQEVQAICDLLSRPEVRLLTITGPGGAGKTRLALEVARVLGSNFVDGSCFVPLAPISDLALVMPTIAEVLDLHETSQQPILSVLQAFLRDKQLLLVLDNFEQVLDAASYLTNLLATCPRLKVLVTSRFVLHVQGEQEFTVPLLAVPDPKHLPDLVTLAQYEAVALFIARTQAVKPDFLLTDANARAVAEICVRLDGLPLAIELAAARSKLLPPQALLTRLEKRLAVLTSGSRTSPARQQTLRKTLQWSYDLLSEEEQRFFRRLSVFVGGFTVEAVAYLFATLGDDAVNVLDGLTSLLDKNLLQQAEQGGDEPRLFMLETVREYGLECLSINEEEEATRYAYVKYCFALTETAGPFMPGSQQQKSFDLLERERSNIWAALQWLTEKKDTEMALQLSIGLSWFWLLRGYQIEERQWLDQALAGSESLPVPLRAKILHGASRLTLYQQNEFRQAQLLAEKMLALNREIGDRRGIGIALRHLGQVAEMRHSYATARLLLEESLEILREASNKSEPDVARDIKGSLAHTLTGMAPVISYLGNFARARSLVEEGLAFFRAIDDKTGITPGLNQLAKVMLAEGDYERARVLGEEALALARESDFKMDIAYLLHFLGQIALYHGDEASAQELLEEALELYRAQGNRWSGAKVLTLLASIAAFQGDDAGARSRSQEGLALLKGVDDKESIAACLEDVAEVVAQRIPAWAARLWGWAQALREVIGRPFSPDEYLPSKRSLAATRAHLGKQAFVAAWNEGRTMTLEQVLVARTSLPTPIAAESASAHPATKPVIFPAGLTTREVEVLRLVAQGHTDAQVAEQLVISPHTVNAHLKAIYGKIGVSSRSAATRYAVEQHLM